MTAKTKKEKQAMIRLAGLRTEKKFFGPRGVFAKTGHVEHLTRRASGNPNRASFPGQPWFVVSGTRAGWAIWNERTEESFVIPGYGEFKGQIKDTYGPFKDARAAEWHLMQMAKGAVVPGERPKKNPITVVGNPPTRINTTVAGVLYNRCLEIRAEKTGNSSLRGLYYHPFLERSKVMVLALDSGDILIHSQVGEKLWKLD